MSVYQSSPDTAPGGDFEPGSLHHFVAGNRGRMLDPRRTPISVVEARVRTGFVVLQVDGFEDAGHYQFARDSRRASTDDVDGRREPSSASPESS